MVKISKINKKDENRVILSDTLPSEVPIIFSNFGFYTHLNKKNGFIYEAISEAKHTHSIPFTYKISKGDSDFRPLSLIHPFNQYNIIKFYKKYSNIICYYTNLSSSSIRCPEKIGEKSKFYDFLYTQNNSNELFKVIDDKPSYFFTYKGVSRLYKFFNSESFLNFEKKFTNLHMIDITKFFPSIYTHSISWAIRDKVFIKDNTSVKEAFSARFDELMQLLNYRETNGIIIGPEISRIFAEIIMQKIDINISIKLEDLSIKKNIDYIFKRYVDDYFIFCNSELTYKKIFDVIKDSLFEYNLHINKEKIKKYNRPFFTDKSKLINNIKKELSNLYNNISYTENKSYYPKKIYKYKKLKNSFINSIKSICFDLPDSLNLCTSYLSSALSKFIEKIISVEPKLKESDDHSNYNILLILLTDILFYLYSLNPTVNSSYKICKVILKIPIFYDKYLPEYSDSIRQSILNFSLTILKQEHYFISKNIIKGTPLEKLNLLLVLSSLGKDYLLPEEFIIKIFDLEKNELTYFDIICSLYYIKDYSEYNKAKSIIESYLAGIFNNVESFSNESEKCHLMLDMLSCPYLSENTKKELLKKLHKKLIGNDYTNDKIDNEYNYHSENHWFVDWNELNLLQSIEQIEVLQSYS